MPIVSCVGLAVEDTVFAMDGAVAVGEKNFAKHIERVGGGPAANAAVTVASLGGSARLVSVVGLDATGDRLIADLNSYEVDTSRIRKTISGPTPESAVVVDGGGERTIVNRTDIALWVGQTVTDSDIEGSDAVLVDLRWLSGAVEAVRIASETGVPSLVDYDLTDVAVPDALLELPSHVIFSLPALVGLTGVADPSKALEMVPSRRNLFVGVTLGAGGVMWREDGHLQHLDAFEVDALGTLGAGDVFHGAFALGLAEGLETTANMRRASAAAALTCVRGGARRGIPSRMDVEAFLKEADG
jgi:sulfofructose kinase